METKFYSFSILTICFAIFNKSDAQVNTDLSNLTAPTKINADLLPISGNTFNLGSPAKSWKNIYLKGGLFLDGNKFISNKGAANTLIGSNAGILNTGSDNTATGYYALQANTTGVQNIASGSFAMFNNINGSYNTVSGVQAMNNNTSGSYNTALGNLSLVNNSSANYNTAVGAQSLYTNNGNNNTAVGFGSLYANTVGNENTALGFQALNFNTSASRNVAIGTGALYSPSDPNDNSQYYTYNVAVGYNALYSNQANVTTRVVGVSNTAVGAYALYANTTGFHNTATGQEALYYNTTGYYNTADGNYALQGNTYGSHNTAVGYSALGYTSEASNNTAVGYDAGGYYTVGWNNVFLGAYTNPNANGYYNDIAIGQGVACTDVSQARIGNSATVSIGGYANWTNISDGRVKRNIKQNVPGLQFINMLQPITYNLDLNAADNIIQAQRKDSTGKIIPFSTIETKARTEKEKIIYTGFVAQDVEKAAKSLNYDFSGVDAAKNSKDLYGLRYAEFVVPLVKAVQELSKQNDSLKNEYNAKFAAQQKEIDELKQMMNITQSTTNYKQQTTNIAGASLQQNVPNPYNNSTTISYILPDKFSSAQIIITDNSGKTLKQVSLSGSGKGVLTVDAASLSAGMYNYSLMVDGKLIATRKMILTK
ncbi:MAG: tail fiber domain-containing protein [Chitinophagaceae bacterium]